MKKHLSILLMLAAITLGCNYLIPVQKLASEAAADNPRPTKSSSEVFLNNDPYGDITDVSRLQKFLLQIFKEREYNGVFQEGSNEIVKDVYLSVDPGLTIGALAALHTALFRSGAHVCIPKTDSGKDDGRLRRPNPLFLVVATQKPASPIDRDIPVYDPRDESSYYASFEFASDPEELLLKRITTDSIEISADENYFF